MAQFSDLLDKVCKEVKHQWDEEYDSDSIVFVLEDGTQYVMYHEQDCCEEVSIDDINGDLQDLVGVPILVAEEVTSENQTPDGLQVGYYEDSYTWTFYKLGTIKGFVDIRWFGSSNGYYSERVNFRKI